MHLELLIILHFSKGWLSPEKFLGYHDQDPDSPGDIMATHSQLRVNREQSYSAEPHRGPRARVKINSPRSAHLSPPLPCPYHCIVQREQSEAL